MITNQASFSGTLVITYDPLPLVTLEALHQIRTGKRHLIPSSDWLFAANPAMSDLVRRELGKDVLSSLQGAKPTSANTPEALSPFNLALEPLRPNVVTLLSDLPGPKSMANITYAGGFLSHSGLAFGDELSYLVGDPKTAFAWLSTLAKTTIAASIYDELRSLLNASRIMAATDAAETVQWVKNYVRRLPGYLAATMALAASDQLVATGGWAKDLLEAIGPQIAQLYALPLPQLCRPALLSFDSQELRDRHQVERVIALPVFNWLESEHLERPETMLAPGFKPFWSPLNFTSASEPDNVLMPDGSHFRKWAGRIQTQDDLETISYAYMYYMASIVMAATPMKHGVHTLAAAASKISSLWAVGRGSVGQRTVTGLPIEANPFLGPDQQEAINAVYCGIYGSALAFEPALSGPILHATRIENSWADAVGDPIMSVIDSSDPVQLIALNPSSFRKSAPVALPNENVCSRAGLLAGSPGLLTSLFTGRRLAEKPAPDVNRISLQANVVRGLTAWATMTDTDISDKSGDLINLIIPDEAQRSYFLDWFSQLDGLLLESTALANYSVIAAQLWARYASGAPTGKPVIRENESKDDRNSYKGGEHIITLLDFHVWNPWQRITNVNKGVPVSPLPDALSDSTFWFGLPGMNIRQSLASTYLYSEAGGKPNTGLIADLAAGRYSIHPVCHVGYSAHRLSHVAAVFGSPNESVIRHLKASCMAYFSEPVNKTLDVIVAKMKEQAPDSEPTQTDALLSMKTVLNPAGSTMSFREKIGGPADSWCLYATRITRPSSPAYVLPTPAPSEAVRPDMVNVQLLTFGLTNTYSG